MIDRDEIDKMVKTVLGESNLYKIDRWKYPDKLCKHQQLYACGKCADEIREERNATATNDQ